MKMHSTVVFASFAVWLLVVPTPMNGEETPRLVLRSGNSRTASRTDSQAIDAGAPRATVTLHSSASPTNTLGVPSRFGYWNYVTLGPRPSINADETWDVRQTPGGKKVLRFLKNLAQGNEGSAKIVSLSINKKTAEIKGKASVRHRHVWPNSIKDVVAYDWTWSADFKFNPATQNGHAIFDLGRGVKLNTKDIERLLKAEWTKVVEDLVHGNPKWLVREFRNDYSNIKKSYGKQYGEKNVYFASKSFVDWASSERLAEWVLRGVSMGAPEAVSHAMGEVQEEAMKEAANLSKWLSERGINDAENITRNMLQGRRVNFPNVKLKGQTVTYTSKSTIGDISTPEIAVKHFAFVVIIEDTN